MLDTEGRELPKDVASYWAQGPIDDARFAALEPLLWRKHIEMIMIDTGDDEAGSIEVVAARTRVHFSLAIIGVGVGRWVLALMDG